MLTKSRTRTLYLAAILSLLATATLASACVNGGEPNSTEDYCRQNPTHC
ncbi:MAG TPA: hypothetical protein VNH46_06570 [Gemmatimonadales bacterium]|nr:hypothetical protein [Gemmatimonadales bacterium]